MNKKSIFGAIKTKFLEEKQQNCLNGKKTFLSGKQRKRSEKVVLPIRSSMSINTKINLITDEFRVPFNVKELS